MAELFQINRVVISRVCLEELIYSLFEFIFSHKYF